MARKKEYKKLPGIKRYSFTRQQLLLGRDHLLSLTTRVFVEEYKRFYFRDIKAIVLRKVESWKITIAVSGFFSALFLGLALLLSGGWTIFFGVMCVPLTGLFIQQLLYGTSSECHLITAVQMEKLPSLYRLRTAKKVIRRLKPLIEEAQGAISAESLQADAIFLPDKGTGGVRSSVGLSEPQKRLRGRWHTAMICLILINALVTSISIDFHNSFFMSLGTLLFFCFLITVIVSLVRQQNSNLFAPLRRLTWVNLGYAIITFVASYFLIIYIMIKHLGFSNQAMQDQWTLMAALSAVSVRNDPVLLSSYLFFIVADLLLGITGFVFILRHRRLNQA